MEVWCHHNLYVGNVFAGIFRTKNNKIIVAMSPLFTEILSGTFEMYFKFSYKITEGGWTGRNVSFLGDSIYPVWNIFSKAVNFPRDGSKWLIKLYRKL